MLSTVLKKKSWPAIIVLAVSLSLTLATTYTIKHNVDAENELKFKFAHNQFVLKIEERINSYALLLRGAAGLFAASDSVTREEWKHYVDSLDVQATIPNVQGIGFSKIFKPTELANHIAQTRNDGFLNYNVRPEGKRAIYTSIVYLEPFFGRNLRAFGYDMFSEPIRRKAMEDARDFNQITLSGKVELVQEDGRVKQAGTLMYYPVYQHGLLTGTLEQRRSSILGWVYIPFRMTDLMTGIIADQDTSNLSKIDLHIYDGTEPATDSLLFDSNSGELSSDTLTASSSMNFFGQNWTIVSHGSAITKSNYISVWVIGSIGVILSFALYIIVVLMHGLQTTAEELADQLTERIRERNTQLSEFAYYDSLTNLPNRRLLFDRLQQVMLSSQRSKKYCAMLFIDLDNFKPLNDEYGHEMGDLLLIEASGRLRGSVRDIDTVARLGGDEFVVLIKDIDLDHATAMANANKVATKILHNIARPYMLQSLSNTTQTVTHTCTASIGVVMFHGSDLDPIEIMKRSDHAMYAAKDAGRNAISFFN